FELHIPVAQLTIDEPELRAQAGPEFPGEVPESAREGTRRNMLSDALLDAAQYPQLTLSSQHLEAVAPGSSLRVGGQGNIRGQSLRLAVPVTYSLGNGALVASGDLPIKQTELGLKPFSALLGALQVQDELHVRFHIVARQAATNPPAR